MKLAKAKGKYQGHQWNAKRRNIVFNMTFDEWYAWWLAQGIDKNISQGPKGPTTLCMCRYNDTGPYQIGNIYCDTISGNVKSQRQNRISNPPKKKGKKIMTPDGLFPTRKDAALFYNIKATSLGDRMKRYPNLYYYL